MGVTAAANLVGAGAAVRVGMRAGSKALKLGRALKRAKSCNSFEPETPILLADGTQAPIADIQVGDLVWTTDPLTGQSSAQPVLDTRTSYGDKHLFTITTHDPETGSSGSLTATAGHEIWVEGTGWTRTDHLTTGDRLRGATGGITLVRAMHDHGWLSHHTVHNLTIANTHTYYAGDLRELVHNAGCRPSLRLSFGGKVHLYRIKDSMGEDWRAGHIQVRNQRWQSSKWQIRSCREAGKEAQQERWFRPIPVRDHVHLSRTCKSSLRREQIHSRSRSHVWKASSWQ